MKTNDKPDNYWPFSTKDNPLTPWTKEQEKKYMDEQRAKVPDSPM